MTDSKAKETKSESEEIMTDSKAKETKSESESESKNESKENANKVKTINRPKNEIRTKLKREQDKVRKFQALKDSILKFSFHRHLTATFTISILFFNSVVSDYFDHHFVYSLQTFIPGNLKDCKNIISYRRKPCTWQRQKKLTP